jgi:hypothetical protein
MHAGHRQHAQPGKDYLRRSGHAIARGQSAQPAHFSILPGIGGPMSLFSNRIAAFISGVEPAATPNYSGPALGRWAQSKRDSPGDRREVARLTYEIAPTGPLGEGDRPGQKRRRAQLPGRAEWPDTGTLGRESPGARRIGHAALFRMSRPPLCVAGSVFTNIHAIVIYISHDALIWQVVTAKSGDVAEASKSSPT